MMQTPHRLITRQSCCGTLKLTEELACEICKPSICRAKLRAVSPKPIKKCERPFSDENATHREKRKVLKYEEIQSYLGRISDTTLTTVREYPSRRKVTVTKNESTLIDNTTKKNDLIVKLQFNFKDYNGYTSNNPLPSSPDLSQPSEENNEIISVDSKAREEGGGEGNVSNEDEEETTIRQHIITISSDKKIFEVTLPTTHDVIHKSLLGSLKKKAALYDSLMNEVSRNKYNGSKLGNSLLGMAASIVPQCGYSGLSTTISFVVASLFANAGINLNHEKLIT